MNIGIGAVIICKDGTEYLVVQILDDRKALVNLTTYEIEFHTDIDLHIRAHHLGIEKVYDKFWIS